MPVVDAGGAVIRARKALSEDILVAEVAATIKVA
jgi:hypothetical protein